MDDFEDGVISPEWQPYADGISTITEEGGAVLATMPDTMGGAFAGMNTIDFFDLTDCAVFTRVGQLADPTTHAYWRLRESNGVTYWETSADAQSWVTHGSDPDPIPLNAVQIAIGAGTYMEEPVAPGTSGFEGLNVP